MSTPLDDTPIAIADWLRAAVTADLVAEGADPITTSYTGIGTLAWDDACGQLTVTPERVFRWTTFPQESVEREVGDPGSIGIDLVTTLIRCVPTLDDHGRAPTGAELQAAHSGILTDAAIIWNQVSAGALPDEWERAAPSQTIEGSEGGAVAIITRVTLGVTPATWCLP